MKNLLVEGIDRVGKSTLINNIMNKLGYYQVIHFGKPQVLERYSNNPDPLMTYQYQLFLNMFQMMSSPGAHLIFDRAHLGECVYAPIYRKYSGDYVFELEEEYIRNSTSSDQDKLILLVEDFTVSHHFKSDGESFDDAKRVEEQNLFIEAFFKSKITNKKIICVTGEDGQFKSPKVIMNEVLSD